MLLNKHQKHRHQDCRPKHQHLHTSMSTYMISKGFTTIRTFTVKLLQYEQSVVHGMNG